MKILKPGREQKDWAKELTCTGYGNNGGGCGALLLVEEPDLYLTERHSFDESDYFVTFKCCGCGTETDLNDGERPSHWTDLPSKKVWQKEQKTEGNQ
jgi:hypothetical protein